MTEVTPPGYVPTPRPTFDSATVIRSEDAVTATWGDDVSGRVFDRIFVSSSKIHHIIYELEPHGAFTHSEEYRTIFAAYEVMYVLSGELALGNPETGEVVRAVPGEAVAFGPDTWHHGFNETFFMSLMFLLSGLFVWHRDVQLTLGRKMSSEGRLLRARSR